MKLIIIIMFLIATVFTQVQSYDINVTSIENNFRVTNNIIQSVTEDVIKLIVTNDKSTETPKIKAFKHMHDHLMTMSEQNYEVYAKIKHITRPDIDKISINVSNISEVVKEILIEEIYNTEDAVKMGDYYVYPRELLYPDEGITPIYKYTTQYNETTVQLFHNVSSEFEDSKELKQFIRDFVVKIKKLSVDDFFKKPPQYNDRSKAAKRLKNDLEVWDPSEDNTQPYMENRRIYKGGMTKIREYPFLASIHIMGQLVCAGSVISSDLILTAASCLQVLYNNRLYRESPETLAVRVGSSYAVREGELIDALEIHFYPTYNPENLNHNIAIIRLKRNIAFKKRTLKVKRIILDETEGILPDNTPGITLLGWGARDRKNIIHVMAKLAVTKLDIYQLDECKHVYSRYYVTNRNFCAGFLSKGGGACNKDAGGPGIIEGTLVGIVSFGPPICGTPDSPTVFTRVGYYLNWIEGIMEEEVVVHKTSTTLLPHIISTKSFHLTLPTVGRMHPILKNSTRSSMDSIVIKQVLEEVISEKGNVKTKALYDEGEWDDNFSSFFTTVTLQRPGEVDYIAVEDDDDDDIFATTEKQNLLDHPLINKSLAFIPEKYGITTEATEAPHKRTKKTGKKVISSETDEDSKGVSINIEDSDLDHDEYDKKAMHQRENNQIKNIDSAQLQNGPNSDVLDIEINSDFDYNLDSTEDVIKAKSIENELKITLKSTHDREIIRNSHTKYRGKTTDVKIFTRNPKHKHNYIKKEKKYNIEDIIKNHEWNSKEIMLLFSSYYKEKLAKNRGKLI